GRRGECGADPRALRLLQLDARADGGRDWVRQARGSAGAVRAVEPAVAFRDAGPDLARLRVGMGRGMAWVADGAPGDQLRLVEPGPRLLHRSRRTRQAR